MAPPLVGVALKVTDVPAQMAPEGVAAMAALTVKFGLTVIVTISEVAGLPDVQVSLEVRIHLTWSPVNGV